MSDYAWTDFEAAERTDYERVSLKKAYVDMTGDLNAGLLLSQIVYWHLSDKKGHAKLRVHHEGYLWLAKTAYEWWDECRLSPKQADRAIGILVKYGYIEARIFKFDGSPTKHVRLLKDKFLADWRKTITTPPENPFRSKVENHLDERAETITDTTTETTTEDAPPPADAPPAKRERKRDLVFDALAWKLYAVPAGNQVDTDTAKRIGREKKNLLVTYPDLTGEEFTAACDYWQKKNRQRDGSPLSLPRDVPKLVAMIGEYRAFRAVHPAAPNGNGAQHAEPPTPIEMPDFMVFGKDGKYLGMYHEMKAGGEYDRLKAEGQI